MEEGCCQLMVSEGRHRAGSSGQVLAGDNVGISTLNVDHPCVPVVDDGKLGTGLFVERMSSAVQEPGTGHWR